LQGTTLSLQGTANDNPVEAEADNESHNVITTMLTMFWMRSSSSPELSVEGWGAEDESFTRAPNGLVLSHEWDADTAQRRQQIEGEVRRKSTVRSAIIPPFGSGRSQRGEFSYRERTRFTARSAF
jgi:hypothetical protein